jgi:hypothetical protein
LGLWFEATCDAASWGGQWGDGNHYSYQFKGRK